MKKLIEKQIKDFLNSVPFLDVDKVLLFGSALYKENPKDIDLLLILNTISCDKCIGCNQDRSIIENVKECDILKISEKVKEYSEKNCYLDIKITTEKCVPEWVTTITPEKIEDTYCGENFFCNIKEIEF